MPRPSVAPLTFLPGSGLLLGLDISTLRTVQLQLSPLLNLLTHSQTRSGHAFGSWEEIPTNFSITDAVAAAAVTIQCHEDLAELDTGTPLSLLSPIPMTLFGQSTTPTPTTRIQRDKLRSKDLFGDKSKHKGFRLVKSSGSTPRPIVDRDGKVCAVYGGMPDDEGFMMHVHDPAVQVLEAARAQASLSYEWLHHRRGNFAPGTTILIPSAAIFHSNIPLQLYTAGGLFRWVGHSFWKEEKFFETLKDAQARQEERLGLKQASAGLALFSTLEKS
ncbi:hypothetical protein K438DRAFT_1774160 [Mycena galopus ATCC 62051]|nr:hypothetical protein K438DRAFT_1774160 [Mycena galopus ATCC 62051]